MTLKISTILGWCTGHGERGASDCTKLNVKHLRMDYIPWICRHHCWPNLLVKIMVMNLAFWRITLYFGLILKTIWWGSESSLWANSIWGPPIPATRSLCHFITCDKRNIVANWFSNYLIFHFLCVPFNCSWT